MSTLRRIGGPNAINTWTYVLTTVVFLVVTMIPSTRDQFIGTLGQRLLLAGVGTLVGFGILAIAWLTVLAPTGRRSRPWTAAAVFAVAGAVQGVVIVILRRDIGLPPVDSVTLVVTRAVAGVLWLSAVAIVVDQVRSHQRRVAELQARIQAVDVGLAREEHELRAEVETMRTRTLAPVRRALDEIAERLSAMAGAHQAEDEAAALRALVDDEVRPLSHALLGEPPVPVDVEAAIELPSRRARLRAVARLAVTAVASPSWLAVVLPVTLILLFAIQQIGLPFLMASATTYLVVVGGLFLVVRAVLNPRLPHMRTWAAAAAVLVAYEGLAVAAVINGWAWGGLSEIGRWVEWPALITLPVIWLGLAVMRASQDQRELVEQQLEGVLGQLSLITARRRQRIRHERQVLGRLLHGSAQATLLSISARLARAADDPDPGPSVALAASDLHDLRESLAAPAGERWGVREALDDLIGLWAGVVDVTLHAPDGVLDVLDATPATRSSVVDVAAEGITNAVRHGGARSVVIDIALAADRVTVVVSDDGRGAPGSVPGMGSGMLDDVACEWGLQVGPGGGILTASVVLDRAATSV